MLVIWLTVVTTVIGTMVPKSRKQNRVGMRQWGRQGDLSSPILLKQCSLAFCFMLLELVKGGY